MSGTGVLPIAAPTRRLAWTVTGTAARASLKGLVEFLVVGGATLLLFPLVWLLRWATDLDTSELIVGFVTFHAAAVINDPHFSVTYLLFYKNARARWFGIESDAGASSVASKKQRLRYVFAGVLVPLVLAGWAISAIVTRSAVSLGLMMQLMFFLVGWHYVKQGFGVLVVLSARQGMFLSARERGWILTHCFCAWFYARASPADPGREYLEQGVVFTSLPHPPGLEAVTQAAFWLSTLGLGWALVNAWRRNHRLPPLAALGGFLVTVWLWVVYSSVDPLMVYLIPALHSVQYLYFVWLMKRNEARAQEGPPLFRRPVAVRVGILAVSAIGLGWLLLHGAPTFFDATLAASDTERAGDLGVTPYLAAFVTFVNLHHYFMDSVLWRRDNPETRFLSRDHDAIPRPASDTARGTAPDTAPDPDTAGQPA
ncbi:MAG TPA: hypothetical protein VI197_09820 [Polyangiaceae bacterium]